MFITIRARRVTLALVILALAAWGVSCSRAQPTAPAQPTSLPVAPSSLAPTPVPQSAGLPPTPDRLLALPEVFRYEVTLRQVRTAAPLITLTGHYREGNWAQTARTGGGPAEEAVLVDGALFTRPAGEATWTRWPSVSFDAAYGLTSPFTVLRLYPLADKTIRGALAPVPGAPVPTFRTQVTFSAATVKRLLAASIAAASPDPAGRAALETQAAPLAVGQTVTYWVGDDQHLYRAAATLLATDDAGQPAPWLDVTWRFWAYDDPTLAVTLPASAEAASGQPIATAAVPAPAADANLIIRVFAAPGLPAENPTVTVYPSGVKGQPIDWRNEGDARFTLPPGRYDVLVQVDYGEEWLRGVEVAATGSVSRDVIFDFGVLKLAVTQAGQPVAADIVTFPAGVRQNWVDWRTDNPATIRLRAGTYDVEISYNDNKAKQTVTGVVIRAGEVTERAVDLGR